jgi:hypothetical protein
MPDLGGDRHRAQQGCEERTEELAPAEHHQLRVTIGELLGGEQAVQEDGRKDEPEHGGEETEACSSAIRSGGTISVQEIHSW